MLAVDTNVLVRVLVDDPDAPEQCRAARKAVADAGAVYVPQVVQIETIWVLAGAYGLDKAGIVAVLNAIAAHPAFRLQGPEIFAAALAGYQSGSADFADLVILAESTQAGCELATFDRKLGKLPGVHPVRPGA